MDTWGFLKVLGKNVVAGDPLQTVEDVKEDARKGQKKKDDSACVEAEAEEVEDDELQG